MEYICPYCGEKVKNESTCKGCHKDLVWVEQIYRKSNAYYVKGYHEAQARGLTTASIYLKKAIQFNKYHIQARNLLGLVYFEKGKIGSALQQWIISASLNKEDNIANEYLDKIQNSPKVLATYKESITLYNKALMYAKQQNNDMAIIRLKKAVSLNTKLVEARNLLALCYMKEKQFYKANEQLKNVLAIDHSNSKALTYFRMLSKEDTVTAQPYELEYIPRQVKGNHVKPARIIDRSQIFGTYVVYFIVGALFMFIVQASLILPNRTKDYKNEIAQLKESELKLGQLLESERKQSQDSLLELQEKNEKMEQEKQAIELTSSKMAQQQKVSEAAVLKNNKEWTASAEVLYNVAPSLLDEKGLTAYQALKEEVYAKAAAILCDEGYQQLNQGEFSESKSKLEKAILYEPTGQILRKSLYYLGRAEKGQGNVEKAKYYFDTVIKEHPGTNEAYWASGELKTLE
jgi:tetratricopeptide (TPR) repeat protein